jgi:hypothetical protein
MISTYDSRTHGIHTMPVSSYQQNLYLGWIAPDASGSLRTNRTIVLRRNDPRRTADMESTRPPSSRHPSTPTL